MRSIKQNFETVVRENTAWLLSLVRSRLHNKELAEDIVQEIWIKAFRAYDFYYNDGRLKPWLARIAQNHLRNYFSQSGRMQIISLDSDSDENESLYLALPSGSDTEEEYLNNELVSEVLRIIAGLPEQQKQVITYRFINGLSLEETAQTMRIPEGSVKSKTHYALDKIKKQLGIGTIKNQKGEFIMECKDIYKYLFMYANRTLSEENKAIVRNHLSDCKACADIVSALEKLIPHMTYAKEDEMSHFLIDFPSINLSFCGMKYEIKDFERLNEILESRNGKIPENETWLVSGFSKCNTLIGMFDNEGNEIKFTVFESDSSHYRTKATYLKKVYRYMWPYQVFSSQNSPNMVSRSKEAPNLYYGSMHNCLGSPAKSALYQAVPGNTENIRIKRGNGVLDCGTYKFPYVDRYVTEEERISLDYSFLLNK